MNSQKIKTVAMIGLGTMGHGIAQVFAAAGYLVRGYDDIAGARDSLRDRCRANLKEIPGFIVNRVQAAMVRDDAIAEPFQQEIVDFLTSTAATSDGRMSNTKRTA